MSKIEEIRKIEYDGNAESGSSEKYVTIDTEGHVIISSELNGATIGFSPNQVERLILILQGLTSKVNE